MMAMSSEISNVLIEKLAMVLHEHLSIIEEAKRGIAVARATMGRDKSVILEVMSKLRMSRAKLLENLRAFNELGTLSIGESEDLIALLGYYIEVAYVNEARILAEARDFVEVSDDVMSLEVLRAQARSILSSLLTR